MSEVYSRTAGQLIENALRDARIISAEQPVQPKDSNNGLIALNNIVKHWQTQGIHLWTEREAILPLVPSQRKYILGPGGDNVANADSFFITSLAAGAVATDTVVSLSALTGLTIDGQSITIAGAPDILDFDPTDSTQDWTTTGATIAVVSGALEVTNTANAFGQAAYNLSATTGRTYRVEFDYTMGTSTSGAFWITDSSGIITTLSLVASGPGVLTFTAREDNFNFVALNGNAILGVTTLVDNLQYRDTEAGNYIGIELDDGSRNWSRVVVTESGSPPTVTISSALPSAAALSNSVYTYSDDIPRPLRLLQARYGDTPTASEIPVDQWSRADYFDQPDKDSQGTVVNWYYSPQLGTGDLYVWQVASSINNVLRFTYVDPLDIPDDVSQTLEFPSEWYLPLKWAIAAELGPGYGIKADRQLVLEQKALTTLNEALEFDVEVSSLQLQPDFN